MYSCDEIEKFIGSSKYSFMNELCGNILDSIENEGYKIQQYIKVISKEMPKVCEKQLNKKDVDFINILKFFIIEYDNIIYSHCLTFVTNVDAFIEDKYLHMKTIMLNKSDVYQYKISRNRLQIYNDYLKKSFANAENGDIFNDRINYNNSMNLVDDLEVKIKMLKDYDVPTTDKEIVDTNTALILFTEVFTAMRKLSYKYKKLIYPGMAINDILKITKMCFELITELLMFLKTVEVVLIEDK